MHWSYILQKYNGMILRPQSGQHGLEKWTAGAQNQFMSVKNAITAPNRDVSQQFLLQQIFGQSEKTDPVVVPPEDVLFVHPGCDREHVWCGNVRFEDLAASPRLCARRFGRALSPFQLHMHTHHLGILPSVPKILASENFAIVNKFKFLAGISWFVYFCCKKPCKIEFEEPLKTSFFDWGKCVTFYYLLFFL